MESSSQPTEQEQQAAAVGGTISGYTCAGIFAANPPTKRAQRVPWAVLNRDENEQKVAYGCGKNIIIRDLGENGW